MNWDQFTVSHKHRRHFSVMVNIPDCCASDLGSIPGQVCQFLTILLLNSSHSTRLMKKFDYLPSAVNLFTTSLPSTSKSIITKAIVELMFSVKAKWDFNNYFPDYMKFKRRVRVEAWMPRYLNFDALSNGEKKNSSGGLQILLQGSQCKIHV